MQFITPDLIPKIARTLGIAPDVAQKAVSAAVPAILASFAGVAAKPSGAQQLSDTLEQQHPDMLSQITSAIGGPNQKAVADTGSGLLSNLLGGGGLNGLVSAVSSFAGVNQNAGKSVLGLLAPMALGAIGQQASGLDARGIANLFASQKDQIAAAMPPGLASMPGARGMLDALDGGLRRGAEGATAAPGRMADAMGDTGAGQVAAGAARRPLTASWPYWLIALAVLAGLGWFFLGNHEQQLAEQTRDLMNKVPGDVANKMAAPNAADLSANLTSSVDNVRTTLQGMTDPASARAAVPKLQQATEQLNKINDQAAQLPPNSRKDLAAQVGASMPTLNALCDKALSNPQIAGLTKPAIDALRAKLQLLAQA